MEGGGGEVRPQTIGNMERELNMGDKRIQKEIETQIGGYFGTEMDTADRRVETHPSIQTRGNAGSGVERVANMDDTCVQTQIRRPQTQNRLSAIATSCSYSSDENCETSQSCEM